MAFNEKEKPEKVFCLFHQKTDCSCIVTVVDSRTLKMRLEHHIRLNNIRNRHETDETEKRQRDEQTILYESRLADLRDSD